MIHVTWKALNSYLKVYQAIDGDGLLDSIEIDDLIEADVFSEIHAKY